MRTALLAVVVAACVFALAPRPADKPAHIDHDRALKAAEDPNNWLLNGRTFDSQHYSPLKQINDQNTGRLGLAWYLDIASTMGLVAEPLVVDGVIYVSAPLSKVYAVDAATGKQLWMFDPQVKLNQSANGSYSARTNAGVAVWNGKVYVGTGDCRLVAADAATGKQVWEAQVCEPSQTGITNAPKVAKGLVFMGYNGSDDGVRGSIAAFDAETGKEVWRFWTVPGDPAKPFESKALEMAAKTWKGKDSWKIGGGDVWTAITYDPVTDLLIFGTAGAGVDFGEGAGVKVEGDKLFAGCIVAVKATTGEYLWHFQTSTPAVQTENNHIMLADVEIGGAKHHAVMTVPKNGVFYVLDAATGKLLSGKPMANIEWMSGYDAKTGKAIETPEKRGGKGWTVHNWWPMAYSPATGLVYVPTTDRKPGTHGEVEFGEMVHESEGRLVAWDPAHEKSVWSAEEPIATNGGVLATGGNLVFQGQGNGEFAAYAADSGKKVWSLQTGSAIDAIPVSYAVNGEQYVLVPVGWGSGSRLFAPAWTMATPQSKRGPSRLLAFKIGGAVPFPTPEDVVPPVPKPPEQTADAATVTRGKQLYKDFYCEGCHSPGIDGSGAWVMRGAPPDLRYAPPYVHKAWYEIVMEGRDWDDGMPGFADPPKFAFPTRRMHKEEADAIHAYVIDRAWAAYNEEHKGEAAK